MMILKYRPDQQMPSTLQIKKNWLSYLLSTNRRTVMHGSGQPLMKMNVRTAITITPNTPSKTLTCPWSLSQSLFQKDTRKWTPHWSGYNDESPISLTLSTAWFMRVYATSTLRMNSCIQYSNMPNSSIRNTPIWQAQSQSYAQNCWKRTAMYPRKKSPTLSFNQPISPNGSRTTIQSAQHWQKPTTIMGTTIMAITTTTTGSGTGTTTTTKPLRDNSPTAEGANTSTAGTTATMVATTAMAPTSTSQTTREMASPMASTMGAVRVNDHRHRTSRQLTATLLPSMVNYFCITGDSPDHQERVPYTVHTAPTNISTPKD